MSTTYNSFNVGFAFFGVVVVGVVIVVLLITSPHVYPFLVCFCFSSQQVCLDRPNFTVCTKLTIQSTLISPFQSNFFISFLFISYMHHTMLISKHKDRTCFDLIISLFVQSYKGKQKKIGTECLASLFVKRNFYSFFQSWWKTRGWGGVKRKASRR